MKRRSVIVGLLIALVAAVAAVAMARSNNDAVDVTAARIERVPALESIVTASGEIVAARYADIGANVMGRIVELTVREGARVEAGQVLARIDPVQASATADAAAAASAAVENDARGARSQSAAAEAALNEARSRAEEAGAALTRSRQLRDSGLIAAMDFDKVQTADAAARAQVASATAALERAKQNAAAAENRIAQARAEQARARDQLSKTAITAPISGIVTRLDVELGEMVVIGVQNQPGTILMTISDLSSINAEIKVAEADVMRLSNGLKAIVTLEGLPNEKFSGRVIEVGASALPQIGNQVSAREFRVRVRLDQPSDRLKPGLTCDADIVAAERANALSAPLQAVVERNGKTGVFTIADGQAKFVPATTGIIGGLSIAVDGVAEGTEIVAGPVQVLRSLTDGSPVRVDAPRR